MLVPPRFLQGWTSLISNLNGLGPPLQQRNTSRPKVGASGARCRPLQGPARGGCRGAWRPLAVRLGRPRLGSWKSGARWG